ncbi:MAG: SDR family NAD(P)-dependent oxidoreductase [Alphaproteobacteria bacterium]|nr:SDR family NAD(P)-dependent oxidoreductase [Alphaproteobacteria bacterium]
MEINGMPALVTGGGSGLGAATARALAAAGANVAVLDRDMAAAETVAKEIGGRAIECDVADAASGEHAVAAARQAHGPAALCINCAGVGPAARIVGRDGPMPLADFARVVEINLIGTFNILRLAAADMAERTPDAEGERGVIINTASIAAFEGQVGQAAYASSKGGVAALTLPAAREFARIGVRVLCIAPGLFATPMLMGLPEKARDSLEATLPFPSRFGRPDEFADLALHMIGNSVMNGTVVRLDSAIRLQPR